MFSGRAHRHRFIDPSRRTVVINSSKSFPRHRASCCAPHLSRFSLPSCSFKQLGRSCPSIPKPHLVAMPVSRNSVSSSFRNSAPSLDESLRFSQEMNPEFKNGLRGYVPLPLVLDLLESFGLSQMPQWCFGKQTKRTSLTPPPQVPRLRFHKQSVHRLDAPLPRERFPCPQSGHLPPKRLLCQCLQTGTSTWGNLVFFPPIQENCANDQQGSTVCDAVIDLGEEDNLDHVTGV